MPESQIEEFCNSDSESDSIAHRLGWRSLRHKDPQFLFDFFLRDIESGKVGALPVNQVVIDHFPSQSRLVCGNLLSQLHANLTFLSNVTQSNDVSFDDGNDAIEDFAMSGRREQTQYAYTR